MKPLCASAEVHPDWWYEQDIFQSDDNFVAAHPSHKVPPERQITAIRAKLLCYSCPLLASCRSDSWGEPAHIWAGLNHNERFRARVDGRVTFHIPKHVESYDNTHRPHIRKRFLSGEDLSDIAASLDRSPQTVWYHVRRLLVQARIEQEELLCSLAPPPPLPEGMTFARYRNGAASSSGWVTDLPPGSPFLSSGEETPWDTSLPMDGD
jgi:WhiB family redox-sensing transcriptional regulator